jgi:hypothetical protein
MASNNPGSAIAAFRNSESIAATLSQADLANAIFRADWARAEAALAGALASNGDNEEARTMYEGALNRWSILRQSQSLSAEDAHRAETAGQALASLRLKR